MPSRPKSFRPSSGESRRKPDRAELERKKFYNSTPWKRLRRIILGRDPLCHDCRLEGKLVAALHVHHVEERLKRPDLALDPGNLISLCSAHHTKRHKAGKDPR